MNCVIFFIAIFLFFSADSLCRSYLYDFQPCIYFTGILDYIMSPIYLFILYWDLDLLSSYGYDLINIYGYEPASVIHNIGWGFIFILLCVFIYLGVFFKPNDSTKKKNKNN